MLQEERRELRKKLEEMDEMEEEVHSLLISVMPNLACKNSLVKNDLQSSQDNTEMNSDRGIYEATI